MELHAGKLPKLLQGAMDNHTFLGALAAVACKQELLLDLVSEPALQLGHTRDITVGSIMMSHAAILSV
jgi:hypothetical protein